jgi:peptide/nickel transport system substrate-binding protein
MKSLLRLLPLVALAVLVLGLVAPVAGQDMMSVSAADCSYGGEFQKIEAVDANTVVFTLCYSDPAFPSKVAFASFGIEPAAYLQSTGGAGDLLDMPVGTGPWKLDHWDKGNEMVFTRNDNYWGDKAKNQTLIFRWNSDASARLVDLQSGTVDGITNPAPGDFDTIKADSSLALFPIPPLNVFYLGINNWFKPFDDAKVRQALAYGIDRQRIVDNFYPAGSVAASQFMPPGIFGNTPESTPFPFDQDKAKQLLQEASTADGFTLPLSSVTAKDGTTMPLTLSYRDVVRGYLPQPNVVATDLQAQLAAIGITVQINKLESATLLDSSSRGDLPLYMLGWGADYPDATDFVDYHFGSGASAQFGDKFPDLTAALHQAGTISDQTQRLQDYLTINNMIRDLVPMVPIAYGASANAYKASIIGAHASPLGNEIFSVMQNPNADSLVFEQNAEPLSLYCGDESDGESLRACLQTTDSLLAYEIGGTNVIPSLASSYDVSPDATVWTFHLREGVKFSDGSDLTANDVVESFAIQWDASSPLHKGRAGLFDYFTGFFGQFLNLPPSTPAAS